MTNNSAGRKKSRRDLRIKLVQTIYQYELFNLKIDSNEIFENNDFDNFQIKIINSLEKNVFNIINIYKKIISSSWTWERITPIIRAILLLGAIELYDLDKRIVIHEYVEITKDFCPDNSFKFVNSTLDFISKVYQKYEIKTTKKTN